MTAPVKQAKKWIAIYSPGADEQFGHVIYERENGERVVCTCVVPVGASHDFYVWPDKEDRGEVVRYVGESAKARSFTQRIGNLP